MNMPKEKNKKDTVLVLCIQEIKEDGSEINIEDLFRPEDIEFLHHAFITDTIENIFNISNVDHRLFFAGEKRTEKSVKTILKYLKSKLKGKKAQALEQMEIFSIEPARWGLKMENVFQKCFDDGYKHVLFIGSRTPTLKPDMIKTALKLLKRSDAVFGPTVEGRYYLLGMSYKYHVQLSSFDWRSPSIYSEVAGHFREKGLSWTEMDIWYAVEHREDLEYLVRDINQYRLEGDESSAKETELVLERILNR